MLHVVRHGQTDWNAEPARCQGWADVPLNGTGRAQAHEKGRRLARHGLRRVVTSHLRRSVQTAEIVSSELDTAACESGGEAAGAAVESLVDERLAETRRGTWEGQLFADIIRDESGSWRAYREHPESFRFPGGESLAEQQLRVLAAVRDAAAEGRAAVLVTHGGSIRLLRVFLDGCGIEHFHDIAVANSDVLEVATAGLVERIDAFLAEKDSEAHDEASRGGCAAGGRPPA